MNESLSITLIATVKDEVHSVADWLDAIARQSRAPDEVIIVDGGSTDGTLEALRSWKPGFPVSVQLLPGASISQGRNCAMAAARGDVIAVTDCGTVAHPDWLEHLTRPFGDPNVDVVSGFFLPGASSRWERALAAATLPDAEELRAERFLPSSRSVAVRSAWVEHGFRYPEWLDYCEDLIWDLQLKRAGARFHLARDALVTFAVRPNARAFWQQYYRYARGDGKAGLFGKRHAVRYATYLGLIAVLIRRRPAELLLAGLFGGAYMFRPLRRLVRRSRKVQLAPMDIVMTAAIVPVQLALGDAAKMTGYPAGLAWRYRVYGTLNPLKSWKRITPEGRMWIPSRPLETPRRLTD